MEEVNNKDTGKLWSNLSQEEKEDILLSYQESEDEDNLIVASEMFGKLKL
ncbi:hypothetical protein [uncultured Mucilaginibacter sp.]|nr:hypothetical protein [uncultured Mucilaginibacter sp.]